MKRKGLTKKEYEEQLKKLQVSFVVPEPLIKILEGLIDAGTSDSN